MPRFRMISAPDPRPHKHLNLLCITHHDKFQGSTRSLFSLLEGLRAYPVTPYVIVPAESAFTAQLAKEGIPFKILPVPWWMSAKHLNQRARIKAAREIQAAARAVEAQIRAWKIDLVYTNSSVTPVGRLAARRAGVPHIWQIREFGDLDFDLHFIFPGWLSRRFISGSEAVICHAKAVQAHDFSGPRPNVYQIVNGAAAQPVFEERLRRRQAAPVSELYTFLMLSVISPKKGQEQAVRALANLRQEGIPSRLILAGSGRQDFLNQLQALVSELDLQDWVSFAGFVNDPLPLYYQADCALVCSENEAFSRVALEAMSTALPVIGKNSGGTPEIIVHGKTGFLYDSFEELVASMKNMVQEPEEARQMGLAGWQRAREVFSIEKCAASVYQIIQSVVNKA